MKNSKVMAFEMFPIENNIVVFKKKVFFFTKIRSCSAMNSLYTNTSNYLATCNNVLQEREFVKFDKI